jgi:ribosomal protein S18 acetylase RimI-like enzyme
MRESDLEAVSELAMLANPHAIKEKYTEHISDELKENPDLSFVAVQDNVVIGYAQAEAHTDKAVLEDIAVTEESQGKNVGKHLLEKELKALKDKAVKIVLADVHYKCAAAIPFYYKHNFRITGFVQDYFGVDHDAIILKLVLE